MANFVLHRLEEIAGPIAVYKLELDGECFWDEFWTEISRDGNLKRQLFKVHAIMEEMSESLRIPPKKLRPLGKTGTLNEFEIKTADLRVYLFHEDRTGRIIVIGGKKGNQTKEMKRFRKIVGEYYQSLKKERHV